jgi:hypothetical protein
MALRFLAVIAALSVCFAQVPSAPVSVVIGQGASGGVYPIVSAVLATTATANDTLTFVCSGTQIIPAMAFATCPGPVVLQPPSPMLAARVTIGWVGMGNSGAFLHVSLSETCLPSMPCGSATNNLVLTCTTPCEIDGQPPTSGEYAVAITDFNLQQGTFFTQPISRWNGYLIPNIVMMAVAPDGTGALGIGTCGPGMTLTKGVTYLQTPWQITIVCQ